MLTGLPLLLAALAPDGSNDESASVREHLSWRAPAECPSEKEIEEAVGALRDPSVPIGRDVRVHVRTEEGHLRVLFDVYGGGRRLGVRRLEITDDCRVSLDTLAFVATLLLEGGALDRAREDEPPVEEAPPLVEREPEVDEPQSSSEEPTEFGGEAFGGAAFRPGLLPVAGASLEVGVALSYVSRYSLGIVGSLFAAESASLATEGSVTTNGGGVRLEGCRSWGESMRFGGCLGAAFFFVEANGNGFEETRRELVFVPAMFGAGRAEWLSAELGMFVRMDAGVGVGLERYSFVTSDGSPIFSQSEAFPWLVAGVGRKW